MSILIIDFIQESTDNIISYIKSKGFKTIRLIKEQFDRKNIENENIKGVICTGSHQLVFEPVHDRIPQFVFELKVPIFCICYSAQLIVEKFGGVLSYEPNKGEDILDNGDTVWTNYNIGILKIPNNFRIVNTFKRSNYIASFENRDEKIFCVIFHPERSKEGSIYNKKYLDDFIDRL